MGAKCCGGDRKRGQRSEAQLKVLVQALSHYSFREPAEPIGAAGGTASFYRLVVDDEERGGEEWLGKDLAHAYDELEFYEGTKRLQDKPEWRLLKYMIEYAGALKDFRVLWVGKEESSLDLLVLRSLVEGYARPRLLDLKIGSKTSAANWKGKSSMASWRQDLLDSFTNSEKEGLRLEGFLNPPDWIDSEDPLHDVGGGQLWSKGVRLKRARRFYFQRMSTAAVLAALVDLRGDAENGLLWPSECAELTLLALLRDLAQILRCCRDVPVPQKWIGSSVALVTEAGSPPTRGSAGPRACARIFDWGRSELNTPEAHQALSSDLQRDREEFWEYYQFGVGRLFWEAARLYWSSFCVVTWAALHIDVYDYDSQTGNDLLGTAEAKLEESAQSLRLLSDGAEVLGKDGLPAVITVDVSFRRCPAPSRLQGSWRVHVKSAAHLPAADVNIASSSSSDPFAVVALLEQPDATATGAPGHGRRRAQARTAVVPGSLDPVWDEVFWFAAAQAAPLDAAAAAGEAALGDAMAGEGGKLTEPGSLARLLPAPMSLGASTQETAEERTFLREFLEQVYGK